MPARRSRLSPVVCNSSPLINLCNVGRTDLLAALYGGVVVPEAVYREVTGPGAPAAHVRVIDELVHAGTIEVRAAHDGALVRLLREELDAGEAEVVALAVQLEARLVLIDEADGRRAAAVYGLEKAGFIGILLRAQREGHVERGVDLLDAARHKGFWIDDTLYRQVVKAFGTQ